MSVNSTPNPNSVTTRNNNPPKRDSFLDSEHVEFQREAKQLEEAINLRRAELVQMNEKIQSDLNDVDHCIDNVVKKSEDEIRKNFRNIFLLAIAGFLLFGLASLIYHRIQVIKQ
jgi:fructose-1,6-bisphosphatase